MVLFIVNVPVSSAIAPPKPSAELPTKVELLTVSVPRTLSIPPPELVSEPVALLPLKVLLVTVAVPLKL